MWLSHLTIISSFLIIDRLVKYFFQGNYFYSANNLLLLKASQNQRLFFWQVGQSFLIGFSLIALGGLFFILIKKKDKRSFLLTDGLLLIILGGASNLYDRIFFGYVIDFIWVFFLPFFTFNIADIMITFGCFLAARYSLSKISTRQTSQ